MEKSKEIYLFHQGTYYHAYNLMGCHPEEGGAWFRCWAPNAKAISVCGDFNGWDASANPMKKLENTGIWEVFVENTKQYDNYKYLITAADDRTFYKADPYAFHSETNGGTASKVYEFEDFDWDDKKYYERKAIENHYELPMNIYEINFGSWKRTKDGGYYTYKMLADELVPYLVEMGYNYVETMPLTEFPFDGSWGYQVTGYFSVTSRYGTPEDFRYFVNKCHENGIGVILDWVPAHFPKDPHGLVEWDGSYLYENQGWDRMEHKGWGTRIFDYGRNEVQSFLISSATFFIDKYHIDGIRVDAVASMLYLDYDRKPGEWIPNVYGENKNLEAIAFLRKLNTTILTEYPNAIMIAEESTAWPMVTKPPFIGGLGFNYKWNIGWMNDTLSYISIDPFFRKDNHDKLTFSMFYAFSENFILPISHDEVVHGKRSLLNKMYGDYDQKFELMRTFLMYMYAHPGKKLTFMGSEFAQFDEWNHEKGIDFLLLEYSSHKSMLEFSKVLNHIYLSSSELYEIDYSWEGFRWLTADDKDNNVVAFERRNKKGETIICVANFSPVPHYSYRVGVAPGTYVEILNSCDKKFGGSGRTFGTLESEYIGVNGFDSSIKLNLQPNSAVYFKKQRQSMTIRSRFDDDESDLKRGINTHLTTIEAKKIVTKIIEARKQGTGEEPQKPQTKSEMLNKIVQQSEPLTEQEVVETSEDAKEKPTEKRGRGRPRKPIDPEIANRPKRGRGRPRKPIDPEIANRPKRGRGRPRKPIDPELANRPKRGRGRPRKEQTENKE